MNRSERMAEFNRTFWKGRKRRPEDAKAKADRFAKYKRDNPEHQKNASSIAVKRRKEDARLIALYQEIGRAFWRSEANRVAIISAVRQKKVDSVAISKALKMRWADPTKRDALLAAIFSDSRRYSQNKLEKKLEKVLKPFGFDYVGDGKVFIGGKVPDFFNKEERMIVELFGNYWHAPDEEIQRIQHFARYGYQCFVIWESEMFDRVGIFEKFRHLAMLKEGKMT